MTKINASFEKPYEFFSRYENLDFFLKIPHVVKQDEYFKYYDFAISGLKNIGIAEPLLPLKNQELKDYLLEMKSTIIDKRSTGNILEAIMFAEDNQKSFISMSQSSKIPKLLSELNNYDATKALEIFNDYRKYLLENSEEAVFLEDKILNESNTMFVYLNQENLISSYTLSKPLTNNVTEEEIEELYDELSNQKEITLPAYNDLDYCPFIFEGKYIIEDYSSDKMFVCVRKDENNFAWHFINRSLEKEIPNEIHDLYYESKAYIKESLENGLNEFTKVVEYKNKRMVSLTSEIEILDLLQGLIVKELVEEGKIKSTIPNLSFKDLVRNYTAQKASWNIEERGLISLLSNLKIIDGKMTYEDFSLINADVVNQLIKSEKEIILPKERIELLESLSNEHINSINEYLEDLRSRRYTDKNINEFIDNIKEAVSNNKKTLGIKKKDDDAEITFSFIIDFDKLKLVDCEKTDVEFNKLREIHKQCMEKNIVNCLGIWDEEAQLARLKKHYDQYGDSLKFITYMDEIIGTINVHPKEFTENNQKVIYDFVEQLYIIPDYQGLGISTRLLSALDYSKEVRLSVLEKDIKTTNFYISRGYEIYDKDEYQSYLKYPATPKKANKMGMK